MSKYDYLLRLRCVHCIRNIMGLSISRITRPQGVYQEQKRCSGINWKLRYYLIAPMTRVNSSLSVTWPILTAYQGLFLSSFQKKFSSNVFFWARILIIPFNQRYCCSAGTEYQTLKTWNKHWFYCFCARQKYYALQLSNSTHFEAF